MKNLMRNGKIKVFEEYYSSHESEETSPPSDSEDEENEVGRPNICHKIRKEVKTTRKIDI